MTMAVGNSIALRMLLNPTPIFGMAIANKMGGRTVPKKAKRSPHVVRAMNLPSQINTGGNTV